jgi:hypothetical protein
MKSQSGLTSTDVTRIVTACAKGGVRSIKYNGLEITFEAGGWANEWADSPSTKVVEDKAELVDNKAIDHESDRDLISEDEIEELKLMNPTAYEEIMERANV